MKKRILALMMAAVLTLGMSVTAFAEEGTSQTDVVKQTYTITISSDVPGHTYEAYQIFKGTLSSDGKTLSDVEWGSGVSDTAKNALGNAAAKAEELANETITAEDFAKEFAKDDYLTNPEGTSKYENKAYKITELESGYYLIKDKDNTVPKNDMATDFILQLLVNVTVKPKASNVTSEKKVDDVNDSTGENNSLQDSADYDIGDSVPFTLTGNIPSNYASFDKYYYEFEDTLDKGLTLDPTSIVVTIDGTGVKDYEFKLSVDNTTNKTTFKIIFADLKTNPNVMADSKITVKYTATLNEKAVIGSTGNKNEFKIIYSNNPKTNEKGETPKDTVIVFTYKVVINKVDEEKKPLAGAKFTLYKLIKNEDNTEAYQEVKTLSATPLDKDGNKIETDANGNVAEANKEKVASYTFSFEGIDDGQYKLEETTVPDGYNKMEDVEFKVVATHTNDDAGENALKLTALNGERISGEITLVTKDTEGNLKEDGSLTADVVNNKGSLLPSTGGIGTTIFYVIGGILVICAGVLLFTKKRMSAENE